MDRWTWPAWVGVVGGLAAFAALLVPLVALQSRRYGRLSGWRLLGAAALAVYGVALLAYTLLPLPAGDLAAWCARYGVGGPQLRPLQFVADIRRDTAGLGLAATLRSAAVLQVVFNVLLFVPWGVLARRYLGWGVLASTLSAAAASLLIETTQATGIFGLIGCAYRLGDVDDLLTNTLGGLIGALLAPVVLGWMPRSGELAATRGLPRPVTAVRRWLGMVVDVVLVSLVGYALVVAHRLLLVATGRPIPADRDLVELLVGTVLPVAVLLWLPPLVGSGASLGQRAMWLEPRWPGPGGTLRRGSLGRRAARGALGAGLWGLLQVLASLPVPGLDGDGVVVVAAVAAVAQPALVVASVLAVPWSRGRRGLSYALTGAELVDARAMPSAGGPAAGRAAEVAPGR
ncbi:VanZ family protein [Cellulomonas pakistanensis]|nr:VanZ family protein [Cellulomonas pakistanensis]